MTEVPKHPMEEEAAPKGPRRLKRIQMKGKGSYTPPPAPSPVNRPIDPKE